MQEIGLEDVVSRDAENVLLQSFGDKYIIDAFRVVSTRNLTPMDNEMAYEALCIMVAMYMQKVQDGTINQDKVLH